MLIRYPSDPIAHAMSLAYNLCIMILVNYPIGIGFSVSYISSAKLCLSPFRFRIIVGSMSVFSR